MMDKTTQKIFDRSTPFPGGKLFSIGFWLLMLSYSVLTLAKTRWQINSIYIASPLLCIAMPCLLMASSQDIRKRAKQIHFITVVIIGYLLLWGMVTALRGMTSFEIKAIRDNFGIRHAAWTWFVPGVIFLSMDPRFLQYLLRAMLNHGLLGLTILFVGWVPPLRLFTHFHLLWGCSALLLFWHHLSKGAKRVALVGAFLQVFFVVLSSSRNAILGHSFLILAASYIGIKRQYKFQGRRKLGIICCYMAVFGVVYYTATHSDFFFLGKNTEHRINTFKEEIFEDTRTGQTSGVNLYWDFLDDMDIWDLAFGRGSIGTYYSMGSGEKYRVNIECGYFQVILKGGGIMLVLMMLLAVPAVLSGFFLSRNWVVKGFAFIILGWLLEMLPFGLPAAFPRYVLFWLSIGVCLNRKLLRMTDEEIEYYLPEGGLGSLKKAMPTKPNAEEGQNIESTLVYEHTYSKNQSVNKF